MTPSKESNSLPKAWFSIMGHAFAITCTKKPSMSFLPPFRGRGQHGKVRHTWILDHPVTVVSLMKFHCRPMVVSERDPWKICVPSLDSLSWDLTGGHKHLFIWAQNSFLPTCTYRLWIRWWNCVSQHVSHNVISADNYQLCWPLITLTRNLYI